MSRQAGPSIVLSVLIVCFFAVALFERDAPRKQTRQVRSFAGVSTARTSGAPAPTGTAEPPGRRADSKKAQSQRALSPPSPLPRDQFASGPNVRVASAGSQPRSVTSRHTRRMKPAGAGGTLPPARVSQTATRVLGARQTPDARASAAGRRITSARSPDSAFTVAVDGETIEDIASRVYGNPDRAESLWRANRDTLPTRDSRLSAGMLLRTPRVE